MSKTKRPLPEGWRWERLADICQVNPRRDKGFQRQPEAPTSFLPMDAIDEYTGTIATRLTRPYSEVSKGYTFFREEDLLFAKITPCMQNGKAAIARGLVDGIGFGTTELHVLRPRPGLSLNWLYLIVRSAEFRKQAEDAFEGSAGQQRVPQSFVEEYRLPLPPTFDDQIAIAANLERRMRRIESMRQAVERQRAALDVAELSLLRQFFADASKTGWRTTRLGELAQVVMGQSPEGSTYNREGKGVPLLNGPTEFGEDHPTPVQWTTKPRKTGRPDDLLICVRGNTTGRMNRADQVYCLGRGVAAIRGKDSKGNTRFIRHAIRYKVAELLTGSERSTFPNIGKEEIDRFEVSAPQTVDGQGEMAAQIERKLNGLKILNAAAARQSEAIIALPGAILREAFDFSEY